jgi:AhpD family alkylhydroperoxidase
MDEKTSLLICLGASAAANCIPCFEHYHKKASAAGLTPEEILEAVELASKVEILPEKCLFAVVGEGMKHAVGLAARTFKAVASAGVKAGLSCQ